MLETQDVILLLHSQTVTAIFFSREQTVFKDISILTSAFTVLSPLCSSYGSQTGFEKGDVRNLSFLMEAHYTKSTFLNISLILEASFKRITS